MCLNLAKSRAKPLVAKKNIRVYKVLELSSNGQYYTPYRYTEFPLLKVQAVDESDWTITKNQAAVSNPLGYIPLHYGFHSFGSTRAERLKDLRKCTNQFVFEAVIPKGAEYYRGMRDEVVSNKLRVLRQVKK